jgi:hypothetical protein
MKICSWQPQRQLSTIGWNWLARTQSLVRFRSMFIALCLALVIPVWNASAQTEPSPHIIKPASYTSSDLTAISKPAANKRVGDHYLMLVNTAIAFRLQDQELAQFDKSPYDGIAVAFSYNYDIAPPPSVAELDAKIAHWNTITKKDIWPWVFVNRMIGVDDNEENHYTKDNAYFHRIKGADLEDKAGALSDFLLNWQNALQAAKDSHVPGIVCDLEFYNYHKEYSLEELARQTGKKPRELVELLRQVGAKMADSAGARYPDATIWFLFTGFGYKGHWTIDNEPYNSAPTYMVMGMLDEIQKKHFPLKVISGGEASLAYCHDSLDKFREKIAARDTAFAPELKKYRDIFELGGTMTLFSDRAAMQGWVKQDCSASQASSVEALEPYLELLLKTFRYNWIYASSDGGYNAFQAQTTPRFDAVIRKAQQQVLGSSPH